MVHDKLWWRSGRLLLVMTLFGWVEGSHAQAEDAVRAEIQALVDTVDAATWVQTSWERLGVSEESTAARCTWVGQHSMRLDVFDGRGAGATAILHQGRVYGFKRGLLSFIKRSYEPDHPRVRSLRGNSMTRNGFMDDLNEVVDQWDQVTVETRSPETVIIRYRDGEGLQSTVHLRRNPIRVLIHERSDRDGLAERYTYSEVRYNPPIEPASLKP